MNWYDHPKKCIAINIWSPAWYHDGITKLDIPSVAKHCHEAGADIVYMWQGWSQDHFGLSYYPTRRGPVHPNLAEGKDHMMEFVEALHQYGIKVVAYYSYVDRVVWDREEDWRQVDEEGKSYEPKGGGGGTGRFGDLCPNSPYRDYVIARQTELVEKYDIDATCLLDSAHFAGAACYCKYCQKKYKSRYGRNIPHYTGEWTAEWAQYIGWKRDCMLELYDDMKAAHRRVRPNFPITHLAFGCRMDYEGFAGLNYERNTETDAFVNSITQWNDGLWDGRVHRNPGYTWISSLTTRYLRAVSKKSVHLHIGRFTYDREYQCMPEHELAVSISAIAAAGGSPSIADNLYPDGSIDEGAYRMIGNIFGELGKKENYLDYEEEVKFAALYYSKDTLDYCGTVYPGENRYTKSIEGAYKFLIEQHMPVQLVVEQDLTQENLQQYKLLILPENVLMTDRQTEAVRQYVHNGGNLLAMGSTSMIGEHAKARDNFALSDVFGADYVSPSIYSFHYYDVTEDSLKKRQTQSNYIISRGDHVKVRLHADAKSGANIILPATERCGNNRAVTFADDMHPGNATDDPAAVLHSYGKGKCVYLSGNLAQVYGTYGYCDIRTLMLNCIRYLTGGYCPLYLDGPRSVEIGAFKKGNQLRVHMVNYAFDAISGQSPEGGVMADQGLPTGKMTLHVNGKSSNFVNAFLASDGTVLDMKITENGVDITIPSLDIHDIVVVEMNEKGEC